MTEKLVLPGTERQETLRPRFEVGMATDRGKNPTRPINEDAVFSVREAMFGFGSSAGEIGLVGVCDGMGGHQAGEIASRLAATAIIDRYRRGAEPGQSLADVAKESLLAANARILDEKQKGTVPIDAGTTGVIALQAGSKVVIAHVGDSRAYVISADRSIRQLTRDHSLVARLVELGQITAEEAKIHPKRSTIYRVLGDEPGVEVDVSQTDLGAGESLVLCSDGLSGMVEDKDISRIVFESPTAQAAADRLIEAANAAGGEDNISAAVIRHGAGPGTEGKDGKVEKRVNETDFARAASEIVELKRLPDSPKRRSAAGRALAVISNGLEDLPPEKLNAFLAAYFGKRASEITEADVDKFFFQLAGEAVKMKARFLI